MNFLDESKKDIIKDFSKFAKNKLKIKKAPTIKVTNGKKELKTTASYDYSKDDKTITVNGKNRALIDILRSIAHELTHHKQWEEGRIKSSIEDGADGSDIENEAHATAGLLIRKYAKLNGNVYDDIK